MKLGIERLLENPSLAKGWGRLGLVANQASLDRHFVPSWRHLAASFKLTTLFGPQHGFESTVQDNMIESDHSTHVKSGLPVYSLYSETREPTAPMLETVDTIVVDLQLSGCRVYTFKYTMAACLRAAKKAGKKVVVLDRPNPLGGLRVEGRSLEMDSRSFVGEFAIPMRHGLSTGELGSFFNSYIGADLTVIEMESWSPTKMWPATYRPWILTSPNLPTFDSVAVYPGMVLLEGTNLSEGRGTALPFQLVGAPFVKDAESWKNLILEKLAGEIPGVELRACEFRPTSQKWAETDCQGLHVIVKDAEKVESFSLGIALIEAAIEQNAEDFKWKVPPYEYEYEKQPMSMILGSQEAVQKLEGGLSPFDSWWQEGLSGYVGAVKAHGLIYERDFGQF